MKKIFRSRPIDINRPLPVYNEAELPLDEELFEQVRQ